MTAYQYVIEQVAAETVLALGVRDRRLLHVVFLKTLHATRFKPLTSVK